MVGTDTETNDWNELLAMLIIRVALDASSG